MNTKLLITCAVCCSGASSFAQGTAFTYQGLLNAGGTPADGVYDFRLLIYDAASGGTQIAGPLTNSAATVSNGLFVLTLDFGAGVFTGPDRWLHIGVRSNGVGAFTALSPRQQLTPAPYAILAGNVVSNGLAAGVYGAAVNFNNAANSFSGDGSGLTGLNASQLKGGTVPAAALGNAWTTSGNGGTTPGANFIGTLDNQPLEFHANGQRIVVLQPDSGTNGSPNFIAGSPLNTVAGGVVGATIGGGGSSNYSGQVALNQALGTFNTVGGGAGNTTGSTNFNVFQATVGGGAFNTASGISSTIAGGSQNLAYNNDAAIGGGFQNRANFRSAVAGGQQNDADGPLAAIGGGYGNNIQTNTAYATIGGGLGNQVQGTGGEAGGTVAGGAFNIISPGYVLDNFAQSAFETIGGGLLNTIGNNAIYATIAGGRGNTIQSASFASTIGGGTNNTIQNSSTNSVIGGGANNLVQASLATISGGQQNWILPGAQSATVAGGFGNTIQSGAAASFIGSGQYNDIWATANNSVIVGGAQNNIQTNSANSVISGGINNTIQANSYGSVIAGGSANLIGGFAPNVLVADVIGGGSLNYIGPFTFGSVIGGGFGNTNNGIYGTILGGYQNYVGPGSYSVAAGYRAKANYQGDFVWADDQNADFNATQNDQFLVRAQRGVGINTASPQQDLSVNGGMNVDQGNNNAGGLNNGSPTGAGLIFGSGSGEGIASQRTAGTLQYSLSFYTSFGNRMVIMNNGAVGIGTTAPTDLFDVNGNAGKPGGGSWSSFSDARLKKNIHSLTNALDELLALRGVSFEYKDPEKIHERPGEQIGMIAQEVEQVFPDWVHETADGYKRLTYHGFEALTVEALRELRSERDEKIAALERANQAAQAALAEQKEENHRLEARLASLETALAQVRQETKPVLTADNALR